MNCDGIFCLFFLLNKKSKSLCVLSAKKLNTFLSDNSAKPLLKNNCTLRNMIYFYSKDII